MIVARNNPFASHRVEALAFRFPGFSLDRILIELENNDWRGAIMGPHGTGKTTLLVELKTALEQRFKNRRCVQLWFVPREKEQQTCQWQRLTASINATEILLVDGIERLSWFRRSQLLGIFPKSFGVSRLLTRSIIATTHRRIGLPIAVRCAANPVVLDDLLLELYPGIPQPMIDRAHELFQQHRGNVRAVFWRLFDDMANIPSLLADRR